MGVTLTTSAWVDLVYHALALLPIDPRDASGLYSAAYARWWADARARGQGGDEPRTLEEDAPILARLYDAAPGASALHGFVTLHRDVDAFLATVARPFASLEWPSRALAARARALRERVPETLLELFRVALWSEARGGYLSIRTRVIEPRYERAAPRLGADLERAGALLGGLDAARWIVSHPLQQGGRLLEDRAGAVTIAIGLPDPALGVPRWGPVIQGCHECTLARVARDARGRGVILGAGSSSTSPAHAGHQGHLALEWTAISLLVDALDRGATRAPLRAWLQGLIPGGVDELRRVLPWARAGTSAGDLADQLRGVVAVAPALRETFAALRAARGAGARSSM